MTGMIDDSSGRPRRNLTGTEAKRLHRSWRRQTERALYLVLDNVQTPFNVGSIVRSAASFRVEHLAVVGAAPVTPEHAKSRKTSLGTERLVPWSAHSSIDEALALPRRAGATVVGVELSTGADPLHEIEIGGAPVCLVFGHEDRGLSRATLAACDRVAFIPTPGKVGSLNVAVAASVALYELRRRDWVTPPAAPSG